jgi:F420-non-reducing hydrogenase small subunit
MAEKIKIAIGQGATCSGCDIAVLDLDEAILDLLAIGDIVFAPLIVDPKFEDLEKMEDGEITITLYHGAVRNSENRHVAEVLRKKSQILISYGACAAFGGVPGLANVCSKERILEAVYQKTATTVNPEHVRPQTHYVTQEGHDLELPELFEEVFALDEVVDVDYVIPACPPTREMNMKVLHLVADFVAGKIELPPKGTIIASERTLCDECPRTKPDRIVLHEIKNIHKEEADPTKCFLEQGFICLGPATRAGCDAQCIVANMPCRGCMGPTKEVIDHGGSMLSALASIMEVSDRETEIPEEAFEKLAEQIRDPLGLFYRFTLPKSILKRTFTEKTAKKEEKKEERKRA